MRMEREGKMKDCTTRGDSRAIEEQGQRPKERAKDQRNEQWNEQSSKSKDRECVYIKGYIYLYICKTDTREVPGGDG
jgi:hypothetical protein